MQPTITIDEANTRVDDYVARAVKALPPETTLKLNFQERSGECSDPIDKGPKNRVVANRSYQLIGLHPELVPTYFDTMRAWWQANNFRVLDDIPRNEFLWVENNTDGFQMTLKANPVGGIFLLAGSPCVWSNGTPEAVAAGEDASSSDGTAIASQVPAPAAVRPVADATQSIKPRRPRPRPSEEEAEGFDQIDWTDEGLY
ncbi:hypothetical protein [Amycolatopsis sp. H20-H5]|uniref:hypothetical protein n=1 Tax=Amycolatopsis sp. H20-H5 TaxID=3046309 RepID=UPI002DB99276|nr:hypothetical protein [Amycolatopsis sp. H20-H5]MEC3982317.1 hypothetical protein [Amycolatopsis sp. H20-H5]